MSYIYQNFYIKAKVELLEQPLPIGHFLELPEGGTTQMMTIPDYLSKINHTVERYSTDGYFIKGFGFNYEGLKELESKLESLGLIIGTNIWILSPAQVIEELKKPEWNAENN